MATSHDNSRTFPSNAAMSQNRLVVLSSNGGVDLAGDDVAGIGILTRDTVEGDTYGAVVRLPGAGTMPVAITATPVTAGDLLYAAATGYAAPTGSVSLGLRAAENSATDGSVIEAVPTF